MVQDNYIYILLPVSISIIYASIRCYEASLIYFKEKTNPITNAVEVVNTTPVISDRYVVVNIS